jgi:hypothetical protein
MCCTLTRVAAMAPGSATSCLTRVAAMALGPATSCLTLAAAMARVIGREHIIQRAVIKQILVGQTSNVLPDHRITVSVLPNPDPSPRYETGVIALIEHPDAVAEVDAFLSVDGIAGATAAPFDLSVNMGSDGRITRRFAKP